VENIDFTRCQALNNIPQKKLRETLRLIEESADDLTTKSIKQLAINRYAESNIPLEYWSLKMERDFTGASEILQAYTDYVADIKATYLKGTLICLAGLHGIGKTFCSTSILKKACQKGYSCLYCQMFSIVPILTSYNNQEQANRELSMVDFLVIDELDQRFFSSEASTQLYARTFESIFRTRTQNKLPTIICTNSPNLVENFTGSLKQSLDSLFSQRMEIISVLAPDHRKNK
jgi:DNA replication protein DnaC